MEKDRTVLLRARVPARRMKNAEEVLARLGLKPGDAVNMLLAQIELRQGLPFEVIPPSAASPVLSAEDQGAIWKEAYGAY